MSRILVADDKNRRMNDLVTKLINIGFEIDYAHNGKIAFNFLQSKQYDALILELQIAPRGIYGELRYNGNSIACAVRKYDKNIPIVLRTAITKDSSIEVFFRDLKMEYVLFSNRDSAGDNKIVSYLNHKIPLYKKHVAKNS
jgi:CheY-like chemotaxis protein